MPFSADEIRNIARNAAEHYGYDVSGLTPDEIVEMMGFWLPPEEKRETPP